MNKSIEEKYNKIVNYIKSLESVIVSYSGGVDSTLLAKICRMTLGKENVLTVTAVGPSRQESEIEDAKRLADEIDINHILIETKEIFNEHYSHNPIDRCFYCKDHLDTIFEDIKNKEKKYKYIVNGTNTDDLKEHRPGIKADKNHSILYPFVEAGFNKEEIRELSKEMKLRTWDKPSNTCLSTRIPIETEITVEKLKQIEECEKILLNMGFENIRVRHLGDTARIELSPKEFKYIILEERLNKIIEKIKKIGFKFVTLDLEGYQTGKMEHKINK